MFEPETILIEKDAESFPLTKEILRRFPDHSVVYNVDPGLKLDKMLREKADVFGAAKDLLLLSHFKGSFLKRCPGISPGMVCCNYYIINLMSNCIYDCSYCFLQEFLEDNPFLKAYVNVEEVLEELDAIFKLHPNKNFRVGTGEIADSLALDDILPYSDWLVPFFNTRENVVLELKTKSSCVENLLKHDPRNVVVSWSINPPEIVEREEKFTASLEDRLTSAKLCQEKGFRIGFHFDPIILFHGWENAYRKTVDKLFQLLEPNAIAWISLGGFRYHTNLKRIVQGRHPDTILFDGEFVPSRDGKYRYLRTLRNQAFETIRGYIKNYSRNIGVYLCMEPKEIWQDVTESLPRKDSELGKLFVI